MYILITKHITLYYPELTLALNWRN